MRVRGGSAHQKMIAEQNRLYHQIALLETSVASILRVSIVSTARALSSVKGPKRVSPTVLFVFVPALRAMTTRKRLRWTCLLSNRFLRFERVQSRVRAMPATLTSLA